MTSIFVTGVSHRAAPVGLRERLVLDGGRAATVLEDARRRGLIAEGLLLSTCNRLEAYGVSDRPAAAGPELVASIARRVGVGPEELAPCLYTKTEHEAVHHCFRVAASLDSMIVGEPQILGQVKDAYAHAERCGMAGPLLHRLMRQALAVAKKVRSETGLGEHAVSAASVAVELARKIFEDLTATSVLLVGAGEMGELAARHLAGHGVSSLTVANRTPDRAVDLARALGGTALPFRDVTGALARVDIVITSTSAPEPVITVEQVRRALGRRRGRPLFFIDLAVPRDIAPGVDALDTVFRYDVDDLQRVADANLGERRREAARAERLVEREVTRFMGELRDLEVVPTIVSLREKLEAIRRQEVARAFTRLPDASPETRRAIEAMSSAIVNKVLHAPTVKLRESCRQRGGTRWTDFVSQLFALEGAPALEK